MTIPLKSLIPKVSNVSFTGVHKVDDSQFQHLQHKDVAEEILKTPPYSKMKNAHPFSYNMPIYRDTSAQPSSWVTEWYVANGKEGKLLNNLKGSIDYVAQKGKKMMHQWNNFFAQNAKSQYYIACSAMVESLISKLPKR